MKPMKPLTPTESNQSEGTDNLNEVLEKYKDRFQGIGKLKGIQVD